MVSRSLFLLSDVGIKVWVLPAALLCERPLLSLRMPDPRSLSVQKGRGLMHQHFHRSPGFLQLIAKIMPVPECCAKLHYFLNQS